MRKPARRASLRIMRGVSPFASGDAWCSLRSSWSSRSRRGLKLVSLRSPFDERIRKKRASRDPRVLRLAQLMKAFCKRGVAMPDVIGRFTPQTFFLLRIVSGLMFMLHGAQKILGWPPMPPGMGGGGPLPTIAIVAGWIEVIGGFLILIGLFTSIAAFVCSGEMAVAYFTVHAKWTGDGWVPIVNQGEAAVLYCFLFLFIAAHGAGIWSVDAAMRKRTPVTGSAGA